MIYMTSQSALEIQNSFFFVCVWEKSSFYVNCGSFVIRFPNYNKYSIMISLHSRKNLLDVTVSTATVSALFTRNQSYQPSAIWALFIVSLALFVWYLLYNVMSYILLVPFYHFRILMY